MRNDREMACDALALTHLGKGLTEPYGQTIIKVLGNLLRPPRIPGVLALWEDKQRLKERIRMIAAFKEWPRCSLLAFLLVLGLAAVGLTNASGVGSKLAPVKRSAPSLVTPAGGENAPLPRNIHGRVMDLAGAPVADAIVKCQGSDWLTKTDPQGRFSWIGAAQPRIFEVWKIGFKTLLTGILVPSEHETSLQLEHAPIIGGKVIDSETRQPISKFEVYHVCLLRGPVTPSLNPQESVQGSSGAFKYAFARYFWPDSAFCIDAEGYKPELSRRLSAGDDGKELVFELTRAQPVAGKVLTPEGSSASKAEVVFGVVS